MNIENQVVDLELSKKLKKAGYLQKGIWWWVSYDNRSPHMYLKSESDYRVNGSECHDQIVAPTVAELGITISKNNKKIHYSSCNCIGNLEGIGTFSDSFNEANCRAKMWLYLNKESKL